MRALSRSRPALAQRGQHRRGLGQHAAPQPEGLAPPARRACPGRRGRARRARSAQSRNGCAAGPYIMSSASDARRQHAGRPPARRRRARLLAVALTTTSKAAPQSARRRAAQRDARRRRQRAHAARPAPAPCGSVRLATVSSSGRACSSGPSAPAAAPPAPISSTRRPASDTPALRSMSRTRPMPSVLSASQPSASKRSVLAAPASVARSVQRDARRGASNLNGTVTLQPRAAARRAKRRTVRSKPSSGHGRRVVGQRLPGRPRELRHG